MADTNSDRNKFGYEILNKTSKSYHFSSTEKDGVRLGCYGYLFKGKKYSTKYVADAKGYRIVNTDKKFTVYPKSGAPR